MSDEIDVYNHVIYALRTAAVKKWPFPHFFAENVFPESFYNLLIDELGEKRDYKASDSFKNRSFGDANTVQCLEIFKKPQFLQNVASIFAEDIKKRFAGQRSVNLYNDVRLVRDQKGYSIGPHTDAIWKVVSLLFYLPESSWYEQYGTSIYLPRDEGRYCEGGPHHSHDEFTRVWTAPYRPNTCLGFFKTKHSFHGVEPVDQEFRRDVLLYNLYSQDLFDLHHKREAHEVTGLTGQLP